MHNARWAVSIPLIGLEWNALFKQSHQTFLNRHSLHHSNSKHILQIGWSLHCADSVYFLHNYTTALFSICYACTRHGPIWCHQRTRGGPRLCRRLASPLWPGQLPVERQEYWLDSSDHGWGSRGRGPWGCSGGHTTFRESRCHSLWGLPMLIHTSFLNFLHVCTVYSSPCSYFFTPCTKLLRFSGQDCACICTIQDILLQLMLALIRAKRGLRQLYSVKIPWEGFVWGGLHSKGYSFWDIRSL